ncbi:TonB-dependent receptor [Sphingomonas sp.]|uniref:TonB-dependent receptor n=1 Tax=Sphingomonas sp. TaxID=28214 RepID=UPI0017B5270A|nr:TonB-dependent receptor [Sphingomonas sp.]MBA3510581.1 TonB-dependent receptor [Sphingomonas sp.]
MKKFALLCSTAFLLPEVALAQSTGSVDFEKDAIIVTGTRVREVGGIQVPDTTKPKAVLTQEIIARQNPGQTILDTVNLVPGVSFQNNDAYGSSGGTLTIRGFDSTRISLTFDGIPLNDSGNYAIYSNQQLDPELIDQVNVNLGTTDVDSPTASAVGGTVNYRTMVPTTDMNFRGLISLGEYDFRRFFGVWNLGGLGPWGTRAYVSASKADNEQPFSNYGKIDKQQYNARIWQPLGSTGDFVALSGHYNQNRNNFFGSVSLRNDVDVPNGFPQSRDDRFHDINYPCRLDTPKAGAVDSPAPAPPGGSSCGTEFNRRYNPSNTGNIRGASRFSITDSITLTVDPSFQYVKANGGGTDTAREYGFDVNPAGGRANCRTAANSATVNCLTGVFAGDPYIGIDLNGDGDLLDTVTILNPSQTRTRRYGVIAGLRWDLNPSHSFRFSYTHDNANHRQTGQVGFLKPSGEPEDVFPINDPVVAASGSTVQKRDRQSYAILNQAAGEWRGEFGALTVNAGVRAPFFKRDLENYCFTSSASGFVECSGRNEAIDAQMAALNPHGVNPVTGRITGWSPPQRRVLKYDKLLPNVGAVYDFTDQLSGFVSFAKGLSVPGTDSLYDAFFFPEDFEQAKPDPETTDTYDSGLRYRSAKVQAQAGVWFTKFTNRLASAYDPELDQTVFRNLGRVDKWGFDGSAAWSPIRELTLYGFGSWNRSKIKEHLQVDDAGGAGIDCDNAEPNTITGIRNCAFTRGNREAGTPKYTFGGSVLGQWGPIDLGVTAKRTGPRFVYDSNEPVFTGDVDCLNGIPARGCTASAPVAQVFGAKAPAYWLVHLDARYNLRSLGLPRTYLQLNVYNLFDKLYVGGFGGGLNQGVNSGGFFARPPFVQIGAPRTISVSLNLGL